MNRPISTRAHGVIDYTWAATARVLPDMLDGAAATRNLIRKASAAAGVNSMVTNYEAGLMRLMPMRAHLAFDVLMSSLLLLSPFFLPSSERRYIAAPVALGAAGLMAALLTQTRSPMEGSGEFRPSYELSEAVADPDVARAPYLRTHLE